MDDVNESGDVDHSQADANDDDADAEEENKENNDQQAAMDAEGETTDQHDNPVYFFKWAKSSKYFI